MAASALPAQQPTIQLNLRSRVEAFKGSGEWKEVAVSRDFRVPETAVLICDMWDDHWCKGSARRAEALAPQLAAVVDAARSGGIQIIHSPSETMNFYQGMRQRQRMLALPKLVPPLLMAISEPPLPIDDQPGCDTPEQFFKAWKRQHAGISIGPDDVISDQSDEIYSFLRERGIRNLLMMGVHANKCVLYRSFGIKRMTQAGIRTVLVRDLTDAMYDPARRPFVSHEAGVELVVEHIEKYWCPTVLSNDLRRALARIGEKP